MLELFKEELEVLEKVEKITLSNYEKEIDGDVAYINKYSLIAALDELLNEFKNLEDEYENYKAKYWEDRI